MVTLGTTPIDCLEDVAEALVGGTCSQVNRIGKSSVRDRASEQ